MKAIQLPEVLTTITAGISGEPNQAIGINRLAITKKKRLLSKELKQMLFGFGDVKNPLPETIDLVEDIVMEHITEMTLKATQVGAKRNKFQTEDLVFLIRKDRKKYARVKELLTMHEELKRARKAFELDAE